ncbi:YrdC domain protein [Haemophilus pittmaniae HK 85]|uniref:YrdC domain protein n=1 Tax=Haemophilus pittmaniae HK 85 TaxID=1035188 RepID=F9QAV1_9PAST|nr:YrdC domain protein [Haemophilus pittmaniae HK 85]
MDLLNALGEPILSCSLMLPDEDHITQADPEEIRDRLEHQVELIIHGGYLGQEPTTVVDLTEDTPIILRQGSGPTSPFIA